MNTKKPNFLIFVVDEMSSFSLEANGNPDVKTPNINKIAAGGHTFRQAYCNNPVCMPSRATLATGLTPRQHGLVTNGCKLPQDIPTIMKVLSNDGYFTCSCGKIHLQPDGGINPPVDFYSKESQQQWEKGEITNIDGYYGFDKVYFHNQHTNCSFGDYYNEMYATHPEILPLYRRENAYYVCEEAPHCWRTEIPCGLHYNDWVADKAIQSIRDNKDKPFFLWCSFPDPHFPFVATKPYSEMYDPDKITISPTAMVKEDLIERLKQDRIAKGWNLSEKAIREITAMTYGAITHVDDCIGRVMNELIESELDQNTVVVFLADHGEYLGSQNLWGKSNWMREELLRVPFVWNIPNAKNNVVDTPVSHLDFVPTVLDLAGIDQKVMNGRGNGHADYSGLYGRSLVPHLRAEVVLEPKPVIFEYDEDLRTGKAVHIRGVIHKGFKLVMYGLVKEGILIDLNDKFEMNNLFGNAKYKEIKNELLEILAYELSITSNFNNIYRHSNC